MATLHRTDFDKAHHISAITETLGGIHTTHIFVHGASSSGRVAVLRAAISGLEKYPERPLVFARPDDVVCVLGRVDKEHLEFLSRLGVGPANGNVVVVSEDDQSNPGSALASLLMDNHEALTTVRSLTKQNKRVVLNPYLLSAVECRLATALGATLGKEILLLGGNLDIVDYADQKHNVRAKARVLGVPVPDGDIVELEVREDGRPLDVTPIRIAMDRYLGVSGRVIVRGSCGRSGSSIFIVENDPESVQRALSGIAERVDNKIYLVEVMHDLIVSPNVLMHIEPDGGKVTCVGISDQRLNGELVHEGNVYPSEANTLEAMKLSARKLSQWLREEGYTGLAGFDFIECLDRKTGQCEHYLAEINPRINAAVYSVSLMEHLNEGQKRNCRPYIEAFLSTKVETKARSFAELTDMHEHLFFDPKTGSGLVPYNIGWLAQGKYNLAVFGRTKDEVMETYRRFRTWK